MRVQRVDGVIQPMIKGTGYARQAYRLSAALFYVLLLGCSVAVVASQAPLINAAIVVDD
jgi:hypothetical protein